MFPSEIVIHLELELLVLVIINLLNTQSHDSKLHMNINTSIIL